jgi:hypothetical protein
MPRRTKRRNISIPFADDKFLHDLAKANSVQFSRVVSLLIYDWYHDQKAREKTNETQSLLFKRYQQYMAEEGKDQPTPEHVKRA